MVKRRMGKIKKNNQGNSFIMVVATLSFLAVLVAAILVAVALCYRLKAYDINARDNFYYLEQAMDEIYAGVGSDAMIHLNEAYEDTVEVLVYFDAASQSYVTMDNTEANVILKNSYIDRVKKDVAYKNKKMITARLNSFLSNPYSKLSYDRENDSIIGSNDVKNKEGIQLSVDNVGVKDDSVTIYNLILKREAAYSTVNTRTATTGNGDTFVQTITTDLVIGEPEFDVNFNTIGSELNDLYAFSMIADKGVEISDATSKVNITGNLYAAADFYNKDYNKDDPAHKDDTRYNTVSSYDENKDDSDYKDRYNNCDGLNEKSMYSGLYINGADVIISSDMLVVPGTIAAFNGANLSIAGSNQNKASSSEVWADGIVLGGYSFLRTPTSDAEDVVGSAVSMRANAYISDDLELNARASSFNLIGNYYGYNYATTDNRTYSDQFLARSDNRTFVDKVADTIKDGATLTGQAHYNSSAIIINGEDSSLDLSLVNNMYIAGQSYIETSKKTTTNKTDPSDETKEYTVVNKSGQNEAVAYNTYEYPAQSTSKVTKTVTKKDSEGNETTTEVTTEEPDNYTTNTANAADKSKNTNIQDYRTGEAISVKSNQLAYQLAYIPNSNVHDGDEGLYVDLPTSLRNLDIFKNNWDKLSRIPIIKTVISGKTYYFFDFSTEATTKAGLTQDVMNNFIAAYADLFDLKDGETISKGEANSLTDITDYDSFQIKMLEVNTSYKYDKDGNKTKPLSDENGNYTNIYSNSAITVKTDTSFTIKSKSSSISPLIEAAKSINLNIKDQRSHMEKDEEIANTLGTLSEDNSQNAADLASDVTTRLQSQYKEVKWMLTAKSHDAAGLKDAHDNLKDSEITPINYYFNFNMIGGSGWKDIEQKLKSGYKVWVNDEDVEIDSKGFTDGNVKGFVVCKGDVTFASDVNSFEGIIVTGSKIIIHPSNTEKKMNISSNEEIVKTILRECDEAQNSSVTSEKNLFKVCELVKQYQSVYKLPDDSDEVETVSAKSISAVQFEDILSFDNWKKNVD